MKTQFFRFVIILLCLGGFTTLNAQGLFDLATLDDEDESFPLTWSAGVDFGYDDAYDALDAGVGWSDFTVGGSAGFGWSDIDGNSATSYCLGVEGLAKIIGEDRNPNGAGYVGAFANYHAGNSDSFDENLFRVGAKFSYFDRISAFNETQLIYGLKAFYETGSREFSSVEDDISGFGLTVYTGINFRLCNTASVGVEVPVISYLNRTFESGGNEIEIDNTSIAINKNNPAMAYVRWNLGSRAK
ncbi:hypothetical protein [Winogradskyella sp. 3972H.M.0a.05]|uniref:hypothetical protein n=1 Tax=Winogradskyella sp. 3972H.M.0a.05 TaxID=2950277 RepID=UPI003397AFE7